MLCLHKGILHPFCCQTLSAGICYDNCSCRCLRYSVVELREEEKWICCSIMACNLKTSGFVSGADDSINQLQTSWSHSCQYSVSTVQWELSMASKQFSLELTRYHNLCIACYHKKSAQLSPDGDRCVHLQCWFILLQGLWQWWRIHAYWGSRPFASMAEPWDCWKEGDYNYCNSHGS